MKGFRAFANFGKSLFQRNQHQLRNFGMASMLVGGYFLRQNWNSGCDQTKAAVDQRFAVRYNDKNEIHDFSNVVLFSGNANKPLAADIAKMMDLKLGEILVGRFSDGEVQIQVKESVRGKDIYIIQPTSTPVNENLVELLLMVATLRRSSARRITVLVPYYGYSRQDRKDAARVPISAADVARLLETVGIDRMVSVDLHCGQIQGFFPPRVPVDNLEAQIVAFNYFVNDEDIPLDDYVVVSPDAGGVARAKKFIDLLNMKLPGDQKSSLAMIIKQREAPGKIGSMNLVGNVAGKNCIIIDDMIDTAGTLCEAAKSLKEHGAKRVYAFATHGLFNGKAFDNIKNSVLEKVIVTDTVPAKPDEQKIDKIIRLSVAPLLAQAIIRLQSKRSISDLFQPKKKGPSDNHQ